MNLKPWMKYALAALFVIGGIGAWFTRDLRQIHGNLDRLRDLVSKSSDEQAIGGLIRAKEISGCFAVPMTVELGAPWPTFSDRDELAAAVHHARGMAKEIKVNIRNKTLKIAADRTTATMDLAAEAEVTMGRQSERDIREFRLQWVKQNGKWLIAKVEGRNTIRRPPGLGDSGY